MTMNTAKRESNDREDYMRVTTEARERCNMGKHSETGRGQGSGVLWRLYLGCVSDVTVIVVYSHSHMVLTTSLQHPPVLSLLF